MVKFEIKKIIENIYSFNFKNTDLIDGNELITTESGNEFTNNLMYRDFDKGIIVTPRGYKNGLIYKSSNNGELYNNPTWLPEMVTFSLNLYGLKKDHFYRVTVRGRNTHRYNRVTDITEDRSIEILGNEKERIIFEDLSETLSNDDFAGIFRATSVEENLYFKIGKIFLNNIMIDEVELLGDEESNVEETKPDFEMATTKSTMAAYGIFSGKLPDFRQGKTAEVYKLSGKGLNLYVDKSSKHYTLERDNANDVIGLPLNNISLYFDINLSKCPGTHLEIVEVSEKISPNTLKQGYLSFMLLDKDNKPLLYDNDTARIYIFANKLN